MLKLMALYSKFYIGLMAFLLMLFPTSGSLQYLHLQQTNSADIAVPKIISAIKEKNVDALEELMCQNIKDNVNDLPEEIGKLMDSIKGEITDSSWKNMGSYNGKRDDGRKIIQANLDIYLTTSEANYKLLLVWEVANSFAKEEAGIRAIVLLIPHGSTLADIRATEGVGEWHD